MTVHSMLIHMNVNEQEATISYAGLLHDLTWGTGAEAGWYLGNVWLCPLEKDIFHALGDATRKLYEAKSQEEKARGETSTSG